MDNILLDGRVDLEDRLLVAMIMNGNMKRRTEAYLALQKRTTEMFPGSVEFELLSGVLAEYADIIPAADVAWQVTNMDASPSRVDMYIAILSDQSVPESLRFIVLNRLVSALNAELEARLAKVEGDKLDSARLLLERVKQDVTRKVSQYGLAAKEPGIRTTSCWVIGRIGHPSAVRYLVSARDNDRAYEVKAMATQAMAYVAVSDESVENELVSLLSNMSSSVREGARKGLDTLMLKDKATKLRIKAKVRVFLEHADQDIRREAEYLMFSF